MAGSGCSLPQGQGAPLLRRRALLDEGCERGADQVRELLRECSVVGEAGPVGGPRRNRTGHYKELKAHMVGLALRRSRAQLEGEFSRLPFEPYAPVVARWLQI